MSSIVKLESYYCLPLEAVVRIKCDHAFKKHCTKQELPERELLIFNTIAVPTTSWAWSICYTASGGETIPGLWHHTEWEVRVQLHTCIDSGFAQPPSKTLLWTAKRMWSICTKFHTYLSQHVFAHFLCYSSYHKWMWLSLGSQRKRSHDGG